jgi:hypothetical protein
LLGWLCFTVRICPLLQSPCFICVFVCYAFWDPATALCCPHLLHLLQFGLLPLPALATQAQAPALATNCKEGGFIVEDRYPSRFSFTVLRTKRPSHAAGLGCSPASDPAGVLKNPPGYNGAQLTPPGGQCWCNCRCCRSVFHRCQSRPAPSRCTCSASRYCIL